MLDQWLNPVVDYLPENNRLERIWKLAQIDFKRRYYNDRLGLLWALINPLFRIVIYYVVFSQVFKSREENFILFLFSGILVYGVFTEISKGGMTVVKSKRYLIENIQFEKVDLFISQSISVFLGFLFNITVYFLAAILLGANLNGYILYFIPVLITLLLTSMSIAMILATLVLYLDDIRHLWDIIVFVGFWTSGILYRADKIVEIFPWFLYLNPFLGMLENTRNSIVYGTPPDYFLLAYNFGISLLLINFSIWLFHKNQHLILEKG